MHKRTEQGNPADVLQPPLILSLGTRIRGDHMRIIIKKLLAFFLLITFSIVALNSCSDDSPKFGTWNMKSVTHEYEMLTESDTKAL